MPTSMLFAVNSEGRVFGLATNSCRWREFPYLGLDFKHLSAVPHYLWAVGGDRQVYLHVHGLDVPIRIKEESFENQRWLPLEGFSKRLLPTDRYNYSSEDGLTERSMDKIHLPSMAWQWEATWQVETSLEGQPLDDDGWTYAVDFPATYHSQKQWSSCVRRRKWVRYRRYSAMNSWCAIAPLHKDPTQEPFIDVCVGGQSVPGSVEGTMHVWAVTAHGRVMWRSGVTAWSPEGVRWSSIPVPAGCEVRSVSCGPTGVMWAVLWSGNALVRAGITGGCPTGESWLEVSAPEPKCKLAEVSCGCNAVWAVTADKRVWFRRGVRSGSRGVVGTDGDTSSRMADEDGSSSAGGGDNPQGTSWVEMVGKMAVISVAPNDQVWSVGSEDRAIYVRTGVSPQELTGRRWRPIHTLSRSASTTCQLTKQHRSTGSLEEDSRREEERRRRRRGQGHGHSQWWEEQSRSAPTSLRMPHHHSPPQRPSADEEERGSVEGPALTLNLNSNSTQAGVGDCDSEGEDDRDRVGGRSVAAWSPVRSVGSLVGMEADPETDPHSALDVEVERSVFRERDECAPGEPPGVWQSDPNPACQWSAIEAGALLLEPTHLANWFLDGRSSFSSSSSLAERERECEVGGKKGAVGWRSRILEELRGRLARETEGFSGYEVAASTRASSSIKSGECRCSLPGGGTSNAESGGEDCLVQLEWTTGESGAVTSGTLTVLSSNSNRTLSQLSVCEITGVMNCSEPGWPRLSIHSSMSTLGGVAPLRLHLTNDLELDDWMAHLTSVCCQFHGLVEAPSPSSVWTANNLGEVYTFDPITFQGVQRKGEEELYCQDLEVGGRSAPLEWALPNSLPPGTRLCFTGIVNQTCERFALDLQCLGEKDPDVAFHFNPRFSEGMVVRNTKTGGSWGCEEREGPLPFTRAGTFVLDIYCWEEAFKVCVNGTVFCYYEHQVKPHSISHAAISGAVEIHTAVYYSKRVILPLGEIFWRQMGGHLRSVETCAKGVTWGLGEDNTPWVYTGGWGGTFLNGLDRSEEGIHQVTDTLSFHVYENQRWNPLSGFTSHGLPTDRPMWSDITGHVRQTKDSVRLPNRHWHWITNWAVDFQTTPGGVDKDGWQYAVDFPATYHGRKQFTDYVRRRRWVRKCRLMISAPWREVGNTRLNHLSLQSTASLEAVGVWAVAADGDALFRRGVTKECPAGINWQHVPCNQPLRAISCGHTGQVWAVAKDGTTYWRFGITTSNPTGEVWETVDPPAGSTIRQVSVGRSTVWAVDGEGKLFVRREVTPVFPEGSHWHPLKQSSTSSTTGGEMRFGQVSVSVSGEEVWAVTTDGVICRRSGVTGDNPLGTSWATGLPGNWVHVSARGHVDQCSQQKSHAAPRQ